MNGLQPVTTRSYRRIHCLPTCPLGTRGTILSRRLTQDRIRWYQVPSDPKITTTAKSGPIIPIRYITRRVPGGSEIILPKPHAAIPLDSRITNLTPLSIELREAPIRRLLQAIDRRQDVQIWHYFSLCAAVMKLRLSAEDFSSVLCSLRPRRFLSLRVRHYLNDNNEGRLTPSNYNYEEFRRRLHIVTKGMQANGHSLGIFEYTHLLDCARAGADTEMAEQLWGQMAQDGITPNTWAYNSYMAAMCGTASIDRENRLTERNLALRIQRPQNARETALKIYRRIIERGVTPNSMTFDIFMLAVARMGDLASVHRTLKEVWGVEVAALSSSETPKPMQPPLMTPDSPLYPSPHTLVSVAVAFGSNNEVETAIRIIDHLTCRYKINITTPTWTALLNWTYVFTRPPAILPKYSVINLWLIMTAAPYKVKPTLEMYDYLVRSLVARKMLPDAEIMINRGLKVFARLTNRAARTTTMLKALNGFPQNDKTYNIMSDLRRNAALAWREESRGRSIVKRWVELLCLGKGMRPEHARIRVPNVVRKMRYFLGENLIYVTPTGYIDLRLGEWEAWRAISIRRRKRAWTPLGTGAKEEDYLD